METINIYPPPVTLDGMKREAISKIDKITSSRILGGFDYQPPVSSLPVDTFEEGYVPTFHFNTDSMDQANFADASTLYLANAMMQNTTYQQKWQGWLNGAQYTLTFDLITYRQFGERYAAHKNDHLANGWIWKNAIRNATSQEEMIAIFQTFDITQEELDLIHCTLITHI